MFRRVCGLACSYLVYGCFSPNPGLGTDGTTGGSGGQPTSGTASAAETGTTDPASETETAPPTSGDVSTSTSAADDDTAAETRGTTDADTSGTEADDGTTDTGEVEDDTIYDIREGEVRQDSMVDVRGVIATAVADNGFFAQEPASGTFSGIWVFTGMGGDPPIPGLGDEVDITGVYGEFFDRSEINASSGSVIVQDSPGVGNVPPVEVLSVASVGEPWEGVLVRIEDDTFQVAEIGSGQQNDFRITDGAGASLWIDDELYDAAGAGDFPGFGLGSSFTSIQGPVNFAFGEYRIAPRGVVDLGGYQQ